MKSHEQAAGTLRGDLLTCVAQLQAARAGEQRAKEHAAVGSSLLAKAKQHSAVFEQRVTNAELALRQADASISDLRRAVGRLQADVVAMRSK